MIVAAAVEVCPAFLGFGGDKSLLDKGERAMAEEILGGMSSGVQAVFFNTSGKCRQCEDIGTFLEELAALSPEFSHITVFFEQAREQAAGFGVERAPAIVLLDSEGRSRGVRYYGLPLGYEYEAFLKAVSHISRGKADLAEETKVGLGDVKQPVTITVFVARH